MNMQQRPFGARLAVLGLSLGLAVTLACGKGSAAKNEGTATAVSAGGGDALVIGVAPPTTTPTPTGGQPAPAVLAELQRQVDAGRLEKPVFETMRDKGAVDALVVIDDDKAMERLKQEAAKNGIPLTDERIVEMKPALFAEIKRQIEAINPSASRRIADFESFGVIEVRFTNAQTLLDVLKRQEVAAVRALQSYGRDLDQSLKLINQPKAAEQGFGGEGTAVVVLDTGVDYTKPAFGSCSKVNEPKGRCRVVFSADVGRSDEKMDDDGHGTNVSGIVAGVAPKANLIVLDVFDAGDQASDRAVLTALDWVLKNRKLFNIVAVNMSLGGGPGYNSQCGTQSNPYLQVFTDLRRAGIMPVVATGNGAGRGGRFNSGISAPACTPGALSVGAVYDSNFGSYRGSCIDEKTAADQVTCFSQTAPYLSLLAAGARITAAGSTQSGTSQAAPHVAGAVAAVWSKCPQANLTQVEKALTENGPKITDKRNNVTKVRLDVAAAGDALQKQNLCKK